MLRLHREGRRVFTVVATLLATGLVTTPAHAVSSGQPVSDAGYEFIAKVDIGGERACSGALIDPRWVITASACFATDTEQPTIIPSGPPSQDTTVTLKHLPDGVAADQQGGATTNAMVRSHPTTHRRNVVELVPYFGRNIVLARLDEAIYDIAPVSVATEAPDVGDTVYSAGYGRTSTDWTPERAHLASFTVQTRHHETLAILGSNEQSSVCRGDAGGPVFRMAATGPVLVAINNTSWQHGCLGETTTQRGATASRLDTLGEWIDTRLLGHWKLDGNLDDVTGNYALSSFGGTQADTTGYDAQAVSLDGVDDHLSTSGPVIDTSRSFTVSAWVKGDEHESWPTALSQDGSRISGFKLQLTGNNVWTFVMFASDTDGGGTQHTRAVAPIESPTGVWTHVTGVYDADDEKIRLYLNGVLAGQTSYTSTWRATGPLQIGAARWNGGKTDFFPGEIDEVRVYQRALGMNEIARLADQSTLVPLTRYHHPDGAHFAATSEIRPPEGFAPEGTLGTLLAEPTPGTIKLYSCKVPGLFDYFASTDQSGECEGQHTIGLLGYLYWQPPKGVPADPVYRCNAGADHFLSGLRSCEGEEFELRLGYILPAPAVT